MEIRDSEKRRARNLIWNAAEEYGFEPDFKVYDETGQADLYWNSIIGAVRKNYGAAPIDALFASIHGSPHEELYEQLIWLGLENAAFCQEAPHRPALPFLREQYARHVLSLSRSGASGDLLAILEEAHFQRALGQNPSPASPGTGRCWTPWNSRRPQRRGAGRAGAAVSQHLLSLCSR
mgnify:CR=1 FL=1